MNPRKAPVSLSSPTTAGHRPDALPALAHPRPPHSSAIVLSLRHGEAEADRLSAGHPALVPSGRLNGVGGDDRSHAEAGLGPHLGCD